MAIKPRLSALFLTAALAAALCACAPKEEAPQVPEEPAVSVLAPEPEPKPEPEPEPPYINPLTGEGCWEDVAQDRPVAEIGRAHV